MKFRGRDQSRFYHYLNGLTLALAASAFQSAATAAPDEKRVGGVDVLSNSYAEPVTTVWNPQLFPSTGHLLYAATGKIPLFDIPTMMAKGSILVERSLAPTQSKFQTYRLRLGQQIYDVSASPDGKNVFLMSGELFDPQDGYSFFLWNREKRAELAPEGPRRSSAYPRVFWSPNSRYLAFYAYREYQWNMGVIQDLSIYDIETDRTVEVPKNDGFPITRPYEGTDVAWTERNTLLFITHKPEKPDAKEEEGPRARGDIYELDVQKLMAARAPRPKLNSPVVVEDADGPMAQSPDGRWLAFQGRPHPSDSEDRFSIPNFDTAAPAEGVPVTVGRGEGLYLFNRQSKKRYCIGNMEEFNPSGSFSYLRWSPDGRKLIATSGATVFDVDLPARTVKRLRRDPGSEKPENTSYRTFWDFEPLAFSPDNSVLLVKSALYKEFTEVKTINLKSGEVGTLARIENAHGVAWVNDTLPFKK